MPTYKVYNFALRVGGQVTAELAKRDVPAPELVMYRSLHGSDAVVRVEAAGTVPLDVDELRTRLDAKFGPDKVAKVFGPHANAPLPRADADADRQAKETAAARVDLDALRATIRAEIEAEMAAGKDFTADDEAYRSVTIGPGQSADPFPSNVMLTLGPAVDAGDPQPSYLDNPSLADMPPKRTKAPDNSVDHLL